MNKKANTGALIAVGVGFALLFAIGFYDFGLKGITGSLVLGDNTSLYCNASVNESSTLVGNISGCGNNQEGLIINASNIVIDCQGWYITSVFTAGSAPGIKISETGRSFDNITIKNCNIENFFRGIEISNATNISLVNTSIFNSSHEGVTVSFVSNSSFVNNTVYDSGMSGFDLTNSHNNLFVNNTAYANVGPGFGMYITSSNNSFNYNEIFNNNNYGIKLLSNATLLNNIFYNNSYGDIDIGNLSFLTIINATFLNPSGSWENYSVLSINDSVSSVEEYYINWSPALILDSGYNNFNNKFVSIKNVSGASSIDKITWSWDEAEVSGYTESKLGLWVNNGTDWNLLNNTPDTTNNVLSVSNLVPASTYGILENVTPSGGSPEDWPMFRYDAARTGYTANTAPTNISNAVSYATGGSVQSSPAVANGYVYIGSDDNKTYQLNASTMVLVNSYTTGGMIRSSPAVSGGYVYVSSLDDKVYQLNASNISILVSNYNISPGSLVSSSPVVSGGYLYVGILEGQVYQLNASNISIKVNNFTTNGQVDSSPAVSGGYVYVGDSNGYVYQLNASTMAQVNNYSTGLVSITSSPAVSGGYVYVGDSNGYVYQLNASNISRLVNSYTTGGIVYSSPAVANGYVYVGSNDNQVYQLNASNISIKVNNFTTGSIVDSSPAVSGGYVYVGSNDNKTYQLNASTMELVSSYTAGGSVYSSSAVSGGYVYVGSVDSKVYRLGGVAPAGNQAPSVSLTEPSNNAQINAVNSVNLNFTVTDDLNTTLNCSLYVNGNLNQTNSSTQNSTLTNFNLNVGLGSYSWYVNCTDGSLSGVSETRIFDVSNLAEDWSMFHYDAARTGYSTNTAPTNISRNVTNYTTPAQVPTSPVLADGYVYLGDYDSVFYKLNASTLAYVDNYTTPFGPTYAIFSSPAVAGGYAYFGDQVNQIYQVNVSSMTLVNNKSLGGQIFSSPVVSGGYLYVGTTNKQVYQLNASTLALVNNFTTGDQISYSSPAVANGYVYIGSDDKQVYQLNASNISIKVANFTTGGIIESSPAVANGYVYIGSDDNKTYQLNASNISRLVNSYTTGGIVRSSPAVANGYVYVGSNDKQVYQLNASNISIKVANFTTGGRVYSSPAVVGGYVFVGSNDTKLYQLNASNVSRLITSYATAGPIYYSSPAVSGGYVYVASFDSKLYRFGEGILGNQAPSVSLTEPSNNAQINAVNSVNLNFTVTDDLNTTLNCSLYVNGNLNQTNFSTQNSTLTNFNLNVGLGSYSWYVNCTDGSLSGVSETRNFDVPNLAEEWSMFHYDAARTGYTTNAAPSNISKNVTNYAMPVATMSSPVVSGGYVYIGCQDNKTYQLNATTLNLVNRYTTGDWVWSSPAVAYGYVYVGSMDNQTYQLNASNISRKIANFTTRGGVLSSPAVANGYVYIGSMDNQVYQLNASNISQKIANFTTGNDVQSSPAVAYGYVYVGSMDHQVYQLNASNVSQKIANYTPGDDIISAPAVANGYVYIGSSDNKVYQLNASNISQKLNEYTTGDNISSSSPAVAYGYVYVGSLDNQVYQLNASNISQKIANFTTGSYVYSSPAVAGGYVYVASYDYQVYQLNASNISRKIANYTTGYPVYSSPAVSDGFVYIGGEDAKVYRLGDGAAPASGLSPSNITFPNSLEFFMNYNESYNETLGVLGEIINVTWQDAGAGSWYNLSYSNDSGATWHYLNYTNLTYFIWQLNKSFPEGTNYTLNLTVSNSTDILGSDVSDSQFWIGNCNVTKGGWAIGRVAVCKNRLVDSTISVFTTAIVTSESNDYLAFLNVSWPVYPYYQSLYLGGNSTNYLINTSMTGSPGVGGILYIFNTNAGSNMTINNISQNVFMTNSFNNTFGLKVNLTNSKFINIILILGGENSNAFVNNSNFEEIIISESSNNTIANSNVTYYVRIRHNSSTLLDNTITQELQIFSDHAGQNVSVHDVRNNTVFSGVIVEGTSGFLCNISGSRLVNISFTSSVLSKNTVNNSLINGVTLSNSSSNIVQNTTIYGAADLSEMSNSSFINTTINALQIHSDISNHNVSVANVLRNQVFSGVIANGTSGFKVELSNTRINFTRFYAEAANSVNVVNNSQFTLLDLSAASKNYFYNLNQSGENVHLYGTSKNYFFNSSINSSTFLFYESAEVNFSNTTLQRFSYIGGGNLIIRSDYLNYFNITTKTTNVPINTNVTRFFPVYVKNSSNESHANANVSVYNSTGSLVWNGTTDANGVAVANVTFTNLTGNDAYNITVRGSVGYGNLSLLSNAPIIIQSEDINQSNITYPNGGEFFTNYNENGTDAGEIINVTWSVSEGGWYYLDYSNNGGINWYNLNYTNNTFYLWNVSKSLGVNESINYTLRVTASDGSSNATPDVSDSQFWVGNCNVSPVNVSGKNNEYAWSDSHIIVCKNRNINFESVRPDKTIILYNSSAFINVTLFNSITDFRFYGPGIVIKNSSINTFWSGTNISVSDSFIAYFKYVTGNGTYDGINTSKDQYHLFSNGDYMNVSNISSYNGSNSSNPTLVQNNIFVYLDANNRANITNSWLWSTGTNSKEAVLFINNTYSGFYWLYAAANDSIWIENVTNGVASEGNVAYSSKGFNLTVSNFTVDTNVIFLIAENITSHISNSRISQVKTGNNSNNSFYNSSFYWCFFDSSINYFKDSANYCSLSNELNGNAVLNFSNSSGEMFGKVLANANATIFGDFNVTSNQGKFINWSSTGKVTRYYPIHVLNSSNGSYSGANVTIYNRTGSVVWNGTTDSGGWVNAPVNFTNDTWATSMYFNDTYNLTYVTGLDNRSVVVRGSVGSAILNFFSDTPIVIRTQDINQSNITYPNSLDFFMNYNESYNETSGVLGEVINVTWTDAGAGAWYNLSYSNDSGATWHYLNYTNLTYFEWRLNRSFVEGTNYSLNLTVSDGVAVVGSDVSDSSFWIGNCNFSQNLTNGDWQVLGLTVCKNRNITLVDTLDPFEEITISNKAALINVSINTYVNVNANANDYYFIRSYIPSLKIMGTSGSVINTTVPILSFQNLRGNISINELKVNTPIYKIINNSVDIFINFNNVTAQAIGIVISAHLNLSIANSNLSLTLDSPAEANASLINTTVINLRHISQYGLEYWLRDINRGKLLNGVLLNSSNGSSIYFNDSTVDIFDLYLRGNNSITHVENSTVRQISGSSNNHTVYFVNSNITDYPQMSDYGTSYIFINSTLSASIGYFGYNISLNFTNSRVKMLDVISNSDIRMYGNFNVSNKGALINWSVPANVTRFFPVYVKNSSNESHANANVSVYNSTGSLVWNGTTDAYGWAEPNVTFTNFTYNNSYSVVVRGSVGSGSLSFFSDTPIVIQTNDNVNFTSVLEGQFFTNYNETGNYTGEIINITWLNVSADRYYVQARTSPVAAWFGINSTNTSTYFEWNISKSRGINESINYSIRIIAEKAGVNVSNITSGQFWIGNCNLTNTASSSWDYGPFVCKNRIVNITPQVNLTKYVSSSIAFVNVTLATVNVSNKIGFSLIGSPYYFFINSTLSSANGFRGAIIGSGSKINFINTNFTLVPSEGFSVGVIQNSNVTDFNSGYTLNGLLTNINSGGGYINSTNSFFSGGLEFSIGGELSENITILNSSGLFWVYSANVSRPNLINSTGTLRLAFIQNDRNSTVLNMTQGVFTKSDFVSRDDGNVTLNLTNFNITSVVTEFSGHNSFNYINNSNLSGFSAYNNSVNEVYNSSILGVVLYDDSVNTFKFLNITQLSIRQNSTVNFTNSTINEIVHVVSSAGLQPVVMGTLKLTTKTIYNWPVNTFVTRYFPIYVKNSSGEPHANANVSVYNSTNGLVGSAITDSEGWVNIPVNFTNTTWGLGNFSIVVRGSVGAGSLNFVSDTPIVIQTGDDVNLTSVLDGQFFTNYNETGNYTGEIINITWLNVSADRYYVQASNNSGVSWSLINSTNTSTYFAWNISKSLGVNESTNYSVRVIAEKAGVNVSNSTSGQFWIGNCNATLNASGYWTALSIVVCKNRKINFTDNPNYEEQIHFRNNAALINVSLESQYVYMQGDDYYLINSNLSTILHFYNAGRIINTSADITRIYSTGNMTINDLRVNVPFYNVINRSGALINFSNFTSPSISIFITSSSVSLNITNSDLALVQDESSSSKTNVINSTIISLYQSSYNNQEYWVKDLNPGIKMNETVINSSIGLSIYFNDSSMNALSLFIKGVNSTTYVQNSTIYSLDTRSNNNTVYFLNSTFNSMNTMHAYDDSYIFVNSTFTPSGYFGYNVSLNFTNSKARMLTVLNNSDVKMYGNFNVTNKGALINWSVPANVTRFFPVYVKNSSNESHANANVSVYNSTGSLVWNGTTDAFGWVYPNVTFTNFTYNQSYSVVVRGSVGSGSLSFFSDTPIVIQTGDDVNLTYPVGGEFFMNYNESGLGTGDIVNITWTDVGADFYRVYISNNSGANWTYYGFKVSGYNSLEWNVSKTWYDESTNWTVRVIAEKAGVNVSNSTSGNFWIGNCNVSPVTSGDSFIWTANKVVVCKNRNIAINSGLSVRQIYFNAESALINISSVLNVTSFGLNFNKGIIIKNSNISCEITGTNITASDSLVSTFNYPFNANGTYDGFNYSKNQYLTLPNGYINFTNFSKGGSSIAITALVSPYQINITNSLLGAITSFSGNGAANLTLINSNFSGAYQMYLNSPNTEFWIENLSKDVSLYGNKVRGSNSYNINTENSKLGNIYLYLNYVNLTNHITNTNVSGMYSYGPNVTNYVQNSYVWQVILGSNTKNFFNESIVDYHGLAEIGGSVILNFSNTTWAMPGYVNLNSNVTIYGNFNVSHKGGFINWSVPANVTRFFPVHVLNRTLGDHSGANVSVYNSTGSLVWNGTTDAFGWVYPNVTFTNFTYNNTYNITVRGSVGYGNLSFFSDTPIIITSGCADLDGDGFNQSEAGCGVADCDDTNYSILPPYDGMRVNRSMTFCPGTYYLNSVNNVTIGIDSNNLTLDCNGASIIGISGWMGISVGGNSNILIENCNLSNFSQTISISAGSNNISLINSVLANSSTGILLADSSNMYFYNISLSDLASNGISSIDCNNSNFSLMTMSNCWRGATMARSENFNFLNIEIRNSSDSGLLYIASENGSIIDSHFYGNAGSDLAVHGNLVSSGSIFVSNLSIDNPLGNFVNYTVINLNDSFSSNENYDLKWSANPGSLPAAKSSFAGKFLNITNNSASGVSINSISFTWNESESSGYNESRFGLWRYSGTNWSLLNGTPDTLNNVLSLSNLNPASTYGILEDVNSPPVVVLNLSLNNTQFNNTNLVNLNFTVTDDYNTTLSCDLYVNGVLNQTNATTLNNTLTDFVVPVGLGTYNWSVNCTDGSLSDVSETWFFFVNDTVKPAIILNYPVDGFITNVSSINFNWTAFDDQDANLTCNLTINGSVNASEVVSLNSTPTNYTVSGFIEGDYLWNVTCWDDSSNINTSETRNFTVDLTPPIVLNLTPLAGTNYTNGSVVAIIVNVTDNVAVDTVIVNITWPTGSEQYIMPNISEIYNFSFTNTSYVGIYNVTITANDTAGNINNTEKTWFNVTPSYFNRAPGIILNLPLNDSIINNEDNVTLNFTVTDNLNTTLNCSLYINGVLNQTNDSTENGTLTDFVVPVGLGAYNWSVNCSDGELSNVSETWYFTLNDSIPPVLTVESPVNNSDYNVTAIDLNYTVSDNYGVSACWYTNVTGQDIYFISCENATFDALQGNNNLTVYANDSSNNLASVTVFFFVDSLPPIISNVTNTTTNDTATINWSTDESANSSVEYGLTISLGGSEIDVSNVLDHSILITGLQNNTLYFYNITSCDVYGNCATVGPFNFTTLQNNVTNVSDLPPSVTSIGCVPNPTDIGVDVTCRANVVDDIGIGNVTANVTKPNNVRIVQNVSCSGTNSSKNCSFTFTNTDRTGTYNVFWLANDTSGSSDNASSSFEIRAETVPEVGGGGGGRPVDTPPYIVKNTTNITWTDVLHIAPAQPKPVSSGFVNKTPPVETPVEETPAELPTLEFKFPYWWLIILIIIFFLFLLLIILKRRKDKKKKAIPTGLAVHDSITDYIRDTRAKGFDDKEIREVLEKVGWTKEQIDQAFKNL